MRTNWLEPLESRRLLSTFPVTNTNDVGAGSLRQAIVDADATPEPDTIQIATSGTVLLNSALPQLHDMILQGSDPNSFIVDGRFTYPVFRVAPGSFNMITGVTVTEGIGDFAGAGGISNQGTLTLSNVVVSFCIAGAGSAGGIFNTGQLTMDNCAVKNNQHVGGFGGGLTNLGVINATNTLFQNNTIALRGGGVYASGPTNLTACTFNQNSASTQGGALYADGPGQLILNACQFLSNSAVTGGAIYLLGSQFNLTGGLFQNNSATGPGGAIESIGAGLTIALATFDSNSANGGGAIDAYGPLTVSQVGFNTNQAKFGGAGGAIQHTAGPLSVSNSIFTACSATDKGGAIYNHDADMDLASCQFASCSAVNGGAVIHQNGQFTATGTSWNHNTATLSGGAVYTQGPTTLTNCVMNFSTAGAQGGAIYAADFLTLASTQIAAGTAHSDGGAVYQAAQRFSASKSDLHDNHADGNGGAVCIDVSALSDIVASTIRLNSAAQGGGVWSDGATLVQESSVHSNSASGVGGGIGESNGTLVVDRCNVYQNTATGAGGIRIQAPGTATITSSSVYANNAGPGFGGGISVVGTNATIVNSTISGNFAAGGGGIYTNGSILGIRNCTIASNTGEGLRIQDISLTTTVQSTILAGNASGDIKGIAPVAVGSSHNLVQDVASAGGLANGVDGNIVGLDPLLKPLANNGGPTQTMEISAGSPAIGAGSNPDNLTSDQRTYLFSRGSPTDIGAYQRQTFALVVDSWLDAFDNDFSAGHLTLREALYFAVPNPGNDFITFAPSMNGKTIVLSTTLQESGDATITGPGASSLTISGNSQVPVFSFLSGSFVLSGLTLTGGQAEGVPGGGVASYCNVKIDSCAITANAAVASLGGGVFNNGTMTIRNSAIWGNSGVGGGGVFNAGTMTIQNCTIAGNTSGGGAGIQNSGTLTIKNSTVASNTGVGVDQVAGSLVLVSTIVAGNSGGDVTGSITLAGSVNNIIQNAASGGGLTDGVNSNKIGVDPLLSALAPNGGSSMTMALRAGSPAISAGTNPDALTTDQRGPGFVRVHGAGVDIGAYEFNASPVIHSWSPALPASQARGTPIALNALVTDDDGPIARVDFYLDANLDGAAQPGELFATDNNSADGFHAVYSQTLPLGTAAFIAIATDNEQQTSAPLGGAITIINAVPLAGTLGFSASGVSRGQSVSLNAAPTDSDGSIARVDFYRDANSNGVVDAGEIIGSDSTPGDGFSLAYSVPINSALGPTQFLAVAIDNDGAASTPAAASLAINNVLPTLGSITPAAASFGKGDPFKLTASLPADADGSVATVRFYADVNNDGIADPSELLGADTDGSDGYSLTLSSAQTAALPTGNVSFLAVAIDNDAGASAPVNAGATALFSTHAGNARLVAGSADGADNARVASVNADGHVIVFEQGWTVADLQAKTGAPAATSDPVIWLDPKDNLTYVAAASGAGLLLFSRSAAGVWSFRNLSTETNAAASPTHGLTQFMSVGSVGVVAGLTDAGAIVGFQQTLTNAPGGGPSFNYIDISGDLVSQGMTTPSVTSLISYVPSWDSWHLAGIDAGGRIQSVWIAPATFTKWRTDDLSSITGAPSASGQLAVTLTSWGGINLTGLDTGGNVLTTWWVPSFGGAWQVTNLTSAFSGAPLAGGKVSGWSTPWGGLNYVGLAQDGKPTVYWWAPGLQNWNVSPLLPDSVASDQWPVGSLTSGSSPAGTLSVYGAAANSDVLRMSWKPGATDWKAEDLTALAARA